MISEKRLIAIYHKTALLESNGHSLQQESVSKRIQPRGFSSKKNIANTKGQLRKKGI